MRAPGPTGARIITTVRWSASAAHHDARRCGSREWTTSSVRTGAHDAVHRHRRWARCSAPATSNGCTGCRDVPLPHRPVLPEVESTATRWTSRWSPLPPDARHDGLHSPGVASPSRTCGRGLRRKDSDAVAEPANSTELPQLGKSRSIPGAGCPYEQWSPPCRLTLGDVGAGARSATSSVGRRGAAGSGAGPAAASGTGTAPHAAGSRRQAPPGAPAAPARCKSGSG